MNKLITKIQFKDLNYDIINNNTQNPNQLVEVYYKDIKLSDISISQLKLLKYVYAIYHNNYSKTSFTDIHNFITLTTNHLNSIYLHINNLESYK